MHNNNILICYIHNSRYRGVDRSRSTTAHRQSRQNVTTVNTHSSVAPLFMSHKVDTAQVHCMHCCGAPHPDTCKGASSRKRHNCRQWRDQQVQTPNQLLALKYDAQEKCIPGVQQPGSLKANRPAPAYERNALAPISPTVLLQRPSRSVSHPVKAASGTPHRSYWKHQAVHKKCMHTAYLYHHLQKASQNKSPTSSLPPGSLGQRPGLKAKHK